MLFTNSPQGASLSVHYEVEIFIDLVTEFIEPFLQKIDPEITINISQGEHYMYLYLDGLGWDEISYDDKTIDKLHEAGFGMDGLQNMNRAITLMCPNRSVTHELDSRGENVCLRARGDGQSVLEAIESIYNSLDDITRADAAKLISSLHKQVRELNWG